MSGNCQVYWATIFGLKSVASMLNSFRSGVCSWVLVALLCAWPANADSPDQNEVSRAVERGEIRPLADMLSMIRSKLPGEVVGVEIEHENGRWQYELRVVDASGRLFEVSMDARTGSIDRIKEK
jgi:hypothetical protein